MCESGGKACEIGGVSSVRYCNQGIILPVRDINSEACGENSCERVHFQANFSEEEY